MTKKVRKSKNSKAKKAKASEFAEFDFAEFEKGEPMPAADNALLNAALLYAKRGWKIFPVKDPWMPGQVDGRRGKAPLTPNGFKDATTDEAVIRNWWSQWPTANIGLAIPHGLTVLDIDGATGHESLAAGGYEVPGSLTVRTGRPEGLHVYTSGNFNCKTRVLPGVDVKACGGYVLLPPSLHECGRHYEWVNESVGTARTPAWLAELMHAPRSPNPAEKSEKSGANGPISEGERNESLFHIGCRMRGRGGMAQDDIFKALIEINEARCQPPLDVVEVEAIAASAARYAADAGNDERYDMSAKKENQLEALLRIASEANLWHNAEGVGFATIRINGTRQNWPIEGKTFKKWLRRQAKEILGLIVNRNSVDEVVAMLDGVAQFDGPCREAHRRIARHDGTVYIDLGDETWHVVAVDASGWRVVSDPPVYFVRSRATKALPVPVSGADIEDLRPFLNVRNDSDFHMCVAWLVGAFRPEGPFAILRFFGAQGCAKSTATRILKSMIDPSVAPLRSAPHTEDDLVIAASHAWVVAYDNLSVIADWLSDALCRLSTGGGLSKRTLYTTAEETVLEVCNPVIFNGIGEIVQRGDAQDRMLDVGLHSLRDGDYKDEKDFWREFGQAAPGILGALLDAVSSAIRRENEVTAKVRMADFCRWVEAAAPALGWRDGYFTALYTSYREQARRDMGSMDELAQFIVEECAPSNGTPSNLLRQILNSFAGQVPSWVPKSAAALSTELERMTPMLRSLGIEVRRTRTAKARNIVITKLDNDASQSSQPSRNPAVGPPKGSSDEARDENRRPASPRIPVKVNNIDADDADDAVEQLFSSAVPQPDRGPGNTSAADELRRGAKAMAMQRLRRMNERRRQKGRNPRGADRLA